MKRRRVEYGVTRAQMAAWLKIDQKEVAALEANRRAWDYSLLDRWLSGCSAMRK
jgi:DNA-binding XRE family transcriptional regulator